MTVSSSPPAPHAKHKRPHYIGIWVGLGALTALELTIAFLPWSKTILILLLIALALWKALLVALYYMHLRFEKGRLRLLAIAPIPFCIIFVTAVLQEHFR
ncbi:MAG: cytochrome C oxidase subunit IV family protein [Gemmatimonadota bacterium]|jgi:cytochrome c oxidase subunit 4|nr:cytochrome C oxidase subunit IV family protein [Gemmatimonadota bacterium]